MEADVPCGPILSMKDLIEDQALARRGMIAEVEHPQRGTFKTVGCPLVLSESPIEITSSPLLGEHTAEHIAGGDRMRRRGGGTLAHRRRYIII